ncbi:MAG TPA: hypothetical protein VFU19_01680 [Iamia sp.]|nr:hypothetical protein [Iamia sp.]
MSIKSGLYAGVATIIVVLALGNQWSYENAVSGTFAGQTRNTISFYLRFEVWNLNPDLRAAAVVRLILLVVLTALLGVFVGGGRPAAAFIGGWTSFLAASVVSAGVYGLVADEETLGVAAPDTVDTFTRVSAVGAPLGIFVGWVVGLAVLRATLDERQEAEEAAPAPPAVDPGPAPTADPLPPAAPAPH